MLPPGWTVEGLAEQLLQAVAALPEDDTRTFSLDADTAGPQTRRLLRPVLACLATKWAAEAGSSPELYGGGFAFKRPGPAGPVWVIGQHENRPGRARVTLRRSTSPPVSLAAPAASGIEAVASGRTG